MEVSRVRAWSSEEGGLRRGTVGGGSVSALRLPDAPNIMFNDINFLLNGPRFDSRCEETPLDRAAYPDP